jgi:hypothetical protein
VIWLIGFALLLLVAAVTGWLLVTKADWVHVSGSVWPLRFSIEMERRSDHLELVRTEQVAVNGTLRRQAGDGVGNRPHLGATCRSRVDVSVVLGRHRSGTP